MSQNDPSLHCYIIVLPDENELNSKQEVVRFQIMPEKITDTKSAVFNDAQIIGRATPLKTYQFSSARKIALTLEFFASIEAKDLEGQEGKKVGIDKVKESVDILRALVNPNYGTRLISRPRKCILRVGKNIGMVGFCTNVGVTYRGDYPWDLDKELAHYASVSLTFEETGESVWSFDDIRNGKDYFEGDVNAGQVATQSFFSALTPSELALISSTF